MELLGEFNKITVTVQTSNHWVRSPTQFCSPPIVLATAPASGSAGATGSPGQSGMDCYYSLAHVLVLVCFVEVSGGGGKMKSSWVLKSDSPGQTLSGPSFPSQLDVDPQRHLLGLFPLSVT